MIEGVHCIPLKQIKDERGKVMHMLRCTDPYFKSFGEVYFSWVYPGFVKAWKKHLVMVLNFAVPVGEIKVVIYDDRIDSPSNGNTNEFVMNQENYYLLTIPNNVWYGFQSTNNKPALIVNCATLPHDPEESITLPYNDVKIPYTWSGAYE